MSLLRGLSLLLLCMPGLAQAELVLLLSDDKPSITGVAQAIAAQYGGKVKTYDLGGNRSLAVDTAAAIRESDNSQVVAIGLLAAQTAREYLSSKQVVFCQVLNYEELDLVTPWMHGVSAIPSLSAQFRAWKLLNPQLRRIGMIASSGMHSLVEEAERAARANGVELVYAAASSDREMMLALDRLAGQIDGLWLAPDSHILGTGSIRSVMSYSNKHNIQTLVFSPALLNEGGLLSGSSDQEEIARLVILQLQTPRNAPEEGVTPLSSARLQINAKAAERFGLSISAQLRGLAHVE
jgi:ABC-type uncharacterized transport system substrate-binding protein